MRCVNLAGFVMLLFTLCFMGTANADSLIITGVIDGPLTGGTPKAVELYALAARYPYVANSQWFEDVMGKHIAAVAASLASEAGAAAQERGRARDLEATVAELLVELEAKVDDEG